MNSGGENAGLTSARISVQSHLMAFAAEKSRLEAKVIHLNDYYREVKETGVDKVLS
ncbi:hypothetical protein D3C72_2583430 [compost metagenome]